LERDAAVFSIRPDFANALMEGRKRFEFRRIRPDLQRGATIFVYSTSPARAVIGTFTCGGIVEDEPSALWERFGSAAGTTFASFTEYFADRRLGYAIRVTRPTAWEKPLSLGAIRHRLHGFHPPQSYRYLDPDEGLFRLLSSSRKNGHS
jgi:predicted transcriptional regulator